MFISEWVKKGVGVDVYDPDSGIWFKGSIIKIFDATDPIITISYPAFERAEPLNLSACKYPIFRMGDYIY